MKKAEEYLNNRYFNCIEALIDLITVVQIDAYNQALEDAVKHISFTEYGREMCEDNSINNIIDDSSILKLKK